MIDYFKEVRAELKHVSWPTRTQTLVSTGVVIGVSLLTALYLGLWDYLFSHIIQRIV
jgi:preprotein translocase subunit SecE